jgi:hypothetical protein
VLCRSDELLEIKVPLTSISLPFNRLPICSIHSKRKPSLIHILVPFSFSFPLLYVRALLAGPHPALRWRAWIKYTQRLGHQASPPWRRLVHWAAGLAAQPCLIRRRLAASCRLARLSEHVDAAAVYLAALILRRYTVHIHLIRLPLVSPCLAPPSRPPSLFLSLHTHCLRLCLRPRIRLRVVALALVSDGGPGESVCMCVRESDRWEPAGA